MQPAPFRVQYCAAITLTTGRSASNLRELRDHVAGASLDSIAHHFYGGLLRPTFDDPEYRNDFALWAQRQLHDEILGERLAAVDPLAFANPEDLRQHLLDVIEDRLAESETVPHAHPGLEFHFLRSRLVVLDTGLRASTPEELASLLPQLTAGNIYFHFVEARRIAPRKSDDFSAWLADWGGDYEAVRQRVASIDFHLWSLAEMHSQLVHCFATLISGGTRA
jgi:hypothetical protein